MIARDSNIELLRIIAAIGVVIIHYNNATMGGAFKFVEAGSINQILLLYLESFFICAVDLFVIISGYFLANKTKLDLLKPIQLIIQVMIYSAVNYWRLVISGIQVHSFKDFVLAIIPANWFVILYVTLYVIAIYINSALVQLDRHNLSKLVVVLVLLFMVYPTLIDTISLYTGETFTGLTTISMQGSQGGYTIVNFVVCYVIDYWIRNNTQKNYSMAKLMVCLSVDVFLIFGLALFDEMKGYGKHESWAYCHPLVVGAAILLFLIFKNIPLGCNKVINRISAASFSVYLVHYRLLRYARIEQFVNENIIKLILHIVLCCVFMYLISFVIYEIYKILTTPIWKAISKKWNNHRFIQLNGAE